MSLVCFLLFSNHAVVVSSLIVPIRFSTHSVARALAPLHAVTTTGFANAARTKVVQPTATTTTTATNTKIAAEKAERIISNRLDQHIPSLDQHWWPVTTEVALSKETPNAVQVLGQPLVLFYDSSINDDPQSNDTHGEWKCLQDMCSHRFAPLSQGKLITTQKTTANDRNMGTTRTDSRLVCRNHKWEFDATGTCRKSAPALKPTMDGSGDIPGVSSYPVQVAVGMVWVYMGDNEIKTDSDANPNANANALPISPMLQKWYDQFGPDACFMRDLPVGMELVAENLLDLSRLPFSLHSIGGLDRSQATPIEMELIASQPQLPKMLVTTSAKKTAAEANKMSGPLPLFQATVLNAATTDPVYRSMKIDIPKNATVTLSYYAPSHIRIHRDRGQSSATEVFLCPISRGKTRLFFFNTFESALNAPDQSLEEPQQTFTFLPPSVVAKKSVYRKALEWCIPAVQRNVLHPTSVRYHMFAHGIFDGDGALLQGNRRRDTTMRANDYDSSGGTADVMVHAVARYLEKAVATTQLDERKDAIAKSILASSDDSMMRADYFGGTPILLDRQSHTNNCRVCKAALQEQQTRYEQLQTAQSALIGAAGASTSFTFLLAAANWKAAVVVRVVAASAVTAVVAALGINKWKQRVFAKLQAFFFQEYKGSGSGGTTFGATKFTRA